MNKLDENQLEQLLSRLKSAPLEQGSFSDLSETEKEILLLAAELKSIPILNPPQAAMRRKYAQKTVEFPVWKTFISFKLAWALAAFALIITTGGISYGVANALPGQKLFGLKKTAEQFRVKFAGSDIDRAYLQVQIAKKRVNEAEQLASEANQNPEQQLAAIKELSHATELAAKEVEGLSPKSIKESSRPLLASLEAVSQKEQDLISTLAVNEKTKDGKEDVIALSLKNQIKVSAIKQSVEVATAEEAIATLSSGPDGVVISGQITQILADKLMVEKTAFVMDDETQILGFNGTELKPNDLKLQTKVAVSGKKTGGVLIALKITVLETASDDAQKQPADQPKGEVRGDNTEKIDLNSTTPAGILRPIINNGESETQAQSLTNPNAATGNFIIEDPKPQYVP